jgi:transcriptional regulatory protein RtcR
MNKKTIIIGMLGSNLDQGIGQQRWQRWRPSVALGQQPDLLASRIELIHDQRYQRLARQVADDLAVVSPESAVRLHQMNFQDPWDFEEVYAALYDFAKNYPFDTENEDYLVHITTGTHVIQICWFLLIESHHLPARILQTGISGQDRRDPAGIYGIIDLDLSRYDKIAARFRQQTHGDVSFLKSGIETRNQAFNSMIKLIEQVGAESSDPILLTGPSGAGKSRLAQLIYQLRKKRRLVQGGFVEVNCATLRGDAAMSTLFGHKKGAFTGAAADRTGLLRAAHHGVLFLDELGALGGDEQAMLLRAIESKLFYPLGADKEVGSDFQLICGSNQPLDKLVVSGKFREDLLARINLWSFRLPGLAERPEDIEPNLDYELERFAERTGRNISFNKEARDLYLKCAASPQAVWRGNFRELGASITRMGTLAQGGRITSAIVKEEWQRLLAMWQGCSADGAGPLEELMGDSAHNLDLFERIQLAGVLRVCRQASSLSQAGRQLFAASRQNKARHNDADRLRKYLAKYNLTWDSLKAQVRHDG